MKAQFWMALVYLMVSAGLFYASSGDEFGGYEFPRVVAIAMLALSVIIALQAWRRAADGPSQDELEAIPLGKLWPSLSVFIGYLLLAEHLGFFVTSFLAFLIIAVLYTPGRLSVVTLLRTTLIGIGFIAVLYLVFVMLLRVQFPHGMFF